jgi:hypothetical protein
MYLALAELQAMTSFTFPAAMPPQRRALATASTIMHCEKCPNEMFTSIQNTQLLSALLFATAERFHKILKAIDAEAEDLERKGEKKPYRIVDSNPLIQNLHTGTPDCPLGFNVQLDAKEWKGLAKKLLRTEIQGGGSNPAPLTALLDQFEERQHKWHSGHDHSHDEERTRIFGERTSCQSGDATCLRLINQVRVMVANMQWE